jgi:hypothetical protein
MRRYLALALFLLQALYAEEEADFSLVNLTKSPIPRVAGTVNIVTGNWVDQSTHQMTTGPDPYIVGHSYISSSLEEGSLADGWDLLHPSTLEVFQPHGITYVLKSPTLPPPGSAPPMLEKGHHTSPPHHPKRPVKPHKDHRAHRYAESFKKNEAKLVYRDSGGARNSLP